MRWREMAEIAKRLVAEDPELLPAINKEKLLNAIGYWD
jgi:hypothetical protein